MSAYEAIMKIYLPSKFSIRMIVELPLFANFLDQEECLVPHFLRSNNWCTAFRFAHVAILKTPDILNSSIFYSSLTSSIVDFFRED